MTTNSLAGSLTNNLADDPKGNPSQGKGEFNAESWLARKFPFVPKGIDQPSLLAGLATAHAEGWINWIQSIQDLFAVSNGCKFSIQSAEKFRTFCRKFIRHSKGRWNKQPFELLDWQWFRVCGPLFGWLRPNGKRRFSKAFVFIPKKNGKTSLAAAISIYMMFDESGAEVDIFGHDQAQAGIAYSECRRMVRKSDDLSQICRILEGQMKIIYDKEESSIQARPADALGAEGIDPSCMVLDELHAWRGTALFDALSYADSARDNSLQFIITTAGADTGSVCYSEYLEAKKILEGKELVDDKLCVIYEAGPKDDWRDIATWWKCNPSMGVTFDEDRVRKWIKEAERSPRKVSALKRYRLNQWVGAGDTWISVTHWTNAVSQSDPITIDHLVGLPCYGGIDLSRSRDLSALAWCARDADEILFFLRLYMPREILREREEEDKVPYGHWAELSHLTLTDGTQVDYGRIRQDLLADCKKLDVEEIGFDPANAGYFCTQQLGLKDGLNVIEVPQSMRWMGPPTTEFERLLTSGSVRLQQNSLLQWMASGVTVYQDSNGCIRPMKRRSTTRIDGIVAMLIALSRQLLHQDQEDSFYDDNEVEFI